MKYTYLNQCFKLQKYNRVFTGEIIPSASLKLKWLAQRTQVRFRRHFTVASLRKKFLGEISGLKLCIIYKIFTIITMNSPS